MLPPLSMLNRLDMATRAHHGEVDAYWLDLLASGVTRAHYKRQLVRAYGFEAPFESALTYTPHLVIADPRERTRSGLIAQDLLALGVSPSKITALPQCDRIAPFEDPAEALAWKYVAERQTLLHNPVKRHLVSRLDVGCAVAYLSVCDGVASSRWHQLGLLLDDVAARPTVTERIIAAAQSAFSCMTSWFKQIVVDP